MIARVLRYLAIMPQLLVQYLLLVWVLARFGVRAGSRYRRSVMRAFAHARSIERERERWASPLTCVRGAVHAVDPAFLQQRVAAQAQRATPLSEALGGAVVLHFTGTGETRHGPLAIIANLLAHSPELATLPHYIVDAPESAAAYAGARAFASELWRDVEPVIDGHAGPFFFVGLSRGALAALELGARVAGDKQKVVSVLACSPPFVRPQELAPAIELIASLEKLVELSSEQLTLFPSAWFRRVFAAVSRPIQTLLTSLVLAELGIDDDDNQKLALRDVAYGDPVAVSLRSVREFAMLTRVSGSELGTFAVELGQFAAKNPLVSAAIVWGQSDPWTPADENRALVARAIADAGGDHAAVQLSLIPNVGHAFCRSLDTPACELRAITLQLMTWAEQKAHAVN